MHRKGLFGLGGRKKRTCHLEGPHLRVFTFRIPPDHAGHSEGRQTELSEARGVECRRRGRGMRELASTYRGKVSRDGWVVMHRCPLPPFVQHNPLSSPFNAGNTPWSGWHPSRKPPYSWQLSVVSRSAQDDAQESGRIWREGHDG